MLKSYEAIYVDGQVKWVGELSGVEPASEFLDDFRGSNDIQQRLA